MASFTQKAFIVPNITTHCDMGLSNCTTAIHNYNQVMEVSRETGKFPILGSNLTNCNLMSKFSPLVD